MKIKDPKTNKVSDVRLPKAFKKKWLKALRSGEFTQAKRVLFSNGGGYCCLGVACRIAHPKMDIINKGFMDKDDFGKKLKDIKVPNILKGSNGTMDDDYNPIVDKLSKMNDDGKSFKMIASYIEKNL